MSNHANSPIEHVVVLMLENRAFDHMLGFTPRAGHLCELEGLTGNEFNYVNPFNPSSQKYFVQDGALYEFFGNTISEGPPHTLQAANTQLSGHSGDPSRGRPAKNNGFVKAFIESLRETASNPRTFYATPDDIKPVMQCFAPEQLPVLGTLAREFMLCDHWFSSVPGVTLPNRLYVHAATSMGCASNSTAQTFDCKTIYNSLMDAGLSWRVYHSDVNEMLLLTQVPRSRSLMPRFERFETDVAASDVANYTFIVPRFIDYNLGDPGIALANDQHAPDNVRMGERLIATVYNALRGNVEIWKKCLLVVVYDEHGGFYDHVIPPSGVPNPDGKNSVAPPFDFKRLGFRVPAVLISPWIGKRLNTTVYEHASIPATLKRFFGLSSFLTQRDSAANSFEMLLAGENFRADTPDKLPLPPLPTQEEMIERAQRPLDSVQRELIQTVLSQAPPSTMLRVGRPPTNQQEAGKLVADTLDRVFNVAERGSQ
jgi:phospholipase C